MIDTDGPIAQTAAKIFADHGGRDALHAAEMGDTPTALWNALTENGLPVAWVGEANGGFGASPAETFGAIWESAIAGSPVPFAETLIANRMLDAAGLPPCEGAAGFALTGKLPTADIAFGAAVDKVVLFDDAQGEVAMFDNRRAKKHAGEEPVEALSPDGASRFVFSGQVAEASAPCVHDRRAFEALILTVRAVQMAATMEAALALSIDHVSAREQFGRPLSKFQAIQHQLAVAASECAASTMAATQAAAAYADNPDSAWHEAVVATVAIRHAVEAVTVPCHQVHGAMGYTQEYPLHHYTRRLWAWRDEMGNEHRWAQALGDELAGALTDSGPDAIWRGISAGDWRGLPV